MSKTGAMFLEQQERDEMAREAGPALAEALQKVVRFSTPHPGDEDSDRIHDLLHILAIAKDALRKAGLEP